MRRIHNKALTRDIFERDHRGFGIRHCVRIT
jgi:hypothetical protein